MKMKLLLIAVIVNIFALSIAQGKIFRTKAVTKLQQLEGRIIGGEPATLGQFPWQALVSYKTSSGTHYCGGSLINDEWILTAAHCVKGGTIFTVRLGTINSWGDDEDTLQTISSSYAIHHESYDHNNFNNDIGLIKLSNKANINQYVWPIELDSTNTQAGTNLTVSGFGITHHNENSGSHKLHHVTVLSISNEKCHEYFSDTYVIDSVICTRGITIEGPCQGDGGGPLVSYIHGYPLHVGVFSFLSSAGCDIGYPSGYARTESFREWIRSKTGV